MKVLSVNLASPGDLEIGQDRVSTGIFKQPVECIRVLRDGVAGDHIGNLKVHGGPDQAVYLYSREDYAFWEEQLGRSLPFGTFGENVTVSAYGSPCIGERWSFGEVELEISAPRIPCSKLAARMGDPAFLKPFVQAARAGVYARVLREGELSAGLRGQTSLPGSSVTAAELFVLWHESRKDPDLLRRALQAPVAERARAALEKWLEKAQ